MSGSPYESSPLPPDMPPPPLDEGIVEYNKDARNWAMAAHLSSLSGFVIPFGNILGPLIVWLIKKDEMPFVNEHGKESLNFQISVTIYILVSAVLTLCVVGFAGVIGFPIFGLVMAIIAAISASAGKAYQYPLTIRLVK